jgi:hypothetical protein
MFDLRKPITISDGIRRLRFCITDITTKIGEAPEITGYISDFDGYRATRYFYGEIPRNSGPIKKVIFNNPATIVVWNDGTKTVVKCQPGDEFNKELGLAMCIAKKYLGNKSNFNNVFKKFIEGYDPREVKV